MLSVKLSHLQHEHAHEGIQQERQDEDREHRSTISYLIAQFAREY
jgi:hypothetical protein